MTGYRDWPTTFPIVGKRVRWLREVRAFEGSDGAGGLPGCSGRLSGRMERAAARGRRREDEGTGCARMGREVALTGHGEGKAEIGKVEMWKFGSFWGNLREIWSSRSIQHPFIEKHPRGVADVFAKSVRRRKRLGYVNDYIVISSYIPQNQRVAHGCVTGFRGTAARSRPGSGI